MTWAIFGSILAAFAYWLGIKIGYKRGKNENEVWCSNCGKWIR